MSESEGTAPCGGFKMSSISRHYFGKGKAKPEWTTSLSDRLLNCAKRGDFESHRSSADSFGMQTDANRVAFLMDSIWKGYPIGSLLIWRTRDRLLYEKQLGPFKLASCDPELPIEYVLDGQQRATSVFGVFQTDLSPEPGSDDSWTHIYFDLMADANAQESQMLALLPSEADPKRHFPMKTLFDTVAYRRATKELDDDVALKVDRLQTVFKEARIPAQIISTDDRTTVAIVFERVNQRGVPLDTLQLLTAWTWSEDFHLQRRFNDLADELEPFGFDDIGEDNNLLLRCCSAVLANDASTKTLIGLNGGVVRDRFEEVANGLRGAIDFLQQNLSVYSISNLPYPAMLIPLSVFFATSGNQQLQYSDDQRKNILRWFWRVCFAKRYNSQPRMTIQSDIQEIKRLRESRGSALGEFPVVIRPDAFQSDSFRMNNVSTKTFILMLAQQQPRSFQTGSPVTLDKVLKDYNRNEFHHMFPRAFLKGITELKYAADCLANICFMSRADNNAIGGVAPSVYRTKMPKINGPILQSAICPSCIFDDDFSRFIEERSQMLSDEANRLVK